MSDQSSDVDIYIAVEKLKKKYLAKRNREASEPVPATRFSSRRCPLNDPPGKRERYRTEEYSSSVFGGNPVQEPLKLVLDPSDGEAELERRRPHSFDESDSLLHSHSFLYTESDVTPPSSLVRTSGSCVMKAAAASGGRRGKAPMRMSRVYQEMLEIHEKLQAERARLQCWAAQLQTQEQLLEQREALLLHHRDTLSQLHLAEQVARSHVCELQEQYQHEFRQLNEALKEKTKENKRIKSSFDAIKEMNEAIKKQLSDVTEQSRRMESQSRKVQARLDNLQRKYEYSMAQKGRENIAPKSQDVKPSRQDRPAGPGKPQKLCYQGSTHSSLSKLLVQTLDWVTSDLLTPPGDTQEGALPGSLLERCQKVLPLLTEQLHMLSSADPALHLPLLRFIYWSLRQLDGSSQQKTLTSTCRRLADELYHGTALPTVTVEPEAPQRGAPPVFFKSPSLQARFLSTLILLKTVTRADVLAQALVALKEDVHHADGRGLFLQYRALPVLSGHLKVGNRTVLSLALDVLLQMAAESGHLHPFLESCSTEEFFHTVSRLLRSTHLEVPLVEKISMLLQKLSKKRKNKQLFELFAIHLTLQEMHRTADPSHSFLVINLSSILFNLGMMKKTPLCDSLPVGRGSDSQM